MKSYFLIVVSTVLFSLQFLFNQKYQNENGNSLKATLSFSIYTSALAGTLLFILNGFKLEFTWFSFIIASIHALTGVLYTYFSLRAFSRINLSVYSVFAMMGGMILPVLYGTAFFNEEFTTAKILCCVLIAFSLALTIKAGKRLSSGILCYGAVFILNGLSGVWAKMHQSAPYPNVSSQSYLLLTNLVTFVCCIAIRLFLERKVNLMKGKSLGYAGGYALFNGIGNLFLLLALKELPASIQYPVVTGGVVVCSTIISFIRKEKLRIQDYLSALIAFIATVMMFF
jgi:drug/metabolite transporter (DMT)-like permease